MTTPKQIYKLTHRYHRLCKRADEARGTVINLHWYHWHELSLETLYELEMLGVDTETYFAWYREAQKASAAEAFRQEREVSA